MYVNTQNAIGLYLDDVKEYPAPSDPAKVSITSEEFLCVVEFNDLEYKKKNFSKSVKKTLTIPEWLNTKAEQHHINFSSVLQDALKSHLNL